MALTLNLQNTESISLEEYVDFCDGHPNLQDPDQAIATACQLRALSNNKRFLVTYLNDEMKLLDRFQERNDFMPPTFILHRGGPYTVRAVVWLPLDELNSPSIFSYFEAHDHNFDFLTCGYYGPGYRTVIYHYEHKDVIGYPGEKVRLEFLEDTTLPEGKVMYYFSSRDVHVQYPPEELSISLNLILPRKGKRAAQYEFDLETQTILSRFGDMRMRRSIFSALKYIGDDNSVDILSSIATRHSCFRTRALAWETLIYRDPVNAGEHLSTALRDPSSYVKTIAITAHRRCMSKDGGLTVAST